MASNYNIVAEAWKNAGSEPTIYARVDEATLERQNNVVAQSWLRANQLAEQTKAPPPSPEVDGYRLAQMRATGSGVQSASEVDRDFVQLTPNAFRQKYGDAIGQQYSAAFAKGDIQRTQGLTGDRSNAQRLGDTANTILTAPVSLVGSLAALGLGGAGYLTEKAGADRVGSALASAGTFVAEGVGGLTRGAQSLQSNELNDARKNFAVEQALRARDNALTAEAEQKQFGTVGGKAFQITRDTIDAFGSMSGNGAMVGDTVANAAGSLLGGGIISKGLRAIGKGVLNKGVTTGAISLDSTLAPKVIDLASKLEMPASMVGMEAGAAYQQTVEQALTELVDRTDLTDEQKVQIANKAGLEAAAIQGAASAVPMAVPGINRIFNSSIERNPFSISSFRKAGKAVLGETVEEGFQEGSAQLAQNKAIQDQVNPNQDIAANVGEGIALGAIGGFGSSAGTQAPAAAVGVPIDAARGVRDVVSSFMGRNSAQAAPEGVGGIDPTTTAPVAENAPEAVPEAPAELPVAKRTAATQGEIYIEPIADTEYDGDQRSIRVRNPETGDVISEGNISVGPDGTLGPVTLFDKVTGEPVNISRGDAEHIRSVASDVTNLPQFSDVELIKPEDAARIEQIDPETKVESVIGGLASLNQEKLDTLRADGVDMVASINPVTKAPEIAVINPLRLVPTTNENNPSTKAAANAVPGFTPRIVAKTLDDAENNPDQIDPDQADKLLFQADDGKVNLSPVQRTSLRSASALVRGVQKASLAASKLFGMKDADKVSREVLTKGAKQTSELGKKSVMEHLADFREAMRTNDTEAAKAVLAELGFFAEHMANKVDALNRAVADGNNSSTNPARYQSYVGNGRFRLSGKMVRDAAGNASRQVAGVHVSLKSAKSVALAQRIATEANAVYEVVNNLVAAFPELGSNPVIPPALNDALLGDANEIAQRNLSPAPASVNEATPEVTTEVAEPVQAPVEPAADTAVDVTEPDTGNVSDAVDVGAVEAPAVVDPVVEQATESRTLKSLFSALIGTTDNVNRFQNAFTLPTESTSRIEGIQQAFQAVRDALLDHGTFENFIGRKLNRKFSPSIASAYSDYLKVGDVLTGLMNDSLGRFLSKNEGSKHSLVSGTSWINGQALNIVEEQEGKYAYNQGLLESAVLAGLNWYLKLGQKIGNLDESDVRQILRLPSDAVLPAGLVDQMNNYGVGPAELSRSLAQEIQKFWGVKQNQNTPRNHAEGVLEAVAKELLSAMSEGFITIKDSNGNDQQVGLFRVNQVDISDVTTNEKITYVNRYSLMLDEMRDDGSLKKGDRIFLDERLKAFSNAIETAVLVEREETTFVGEPPKAVSKTQLRNSAVSNSPKQLKALEVQQNVAHRLNMPFIETLLDMGEDMVLRLFAGGELDPTRLNAQHLLSLKGKNLTVQSAFRSIERMLAEANDVFEENPGEVPVYFAYDTTVVNRQQMMGRDNPQSNKLMREAVLPTWHTLDLTDPAMQELFQLGLAQALGVKVHTQSREKSIADLNKKLAGFPETLKLMNRDSKLKFTPEAIDTMKAEGINSPVALHAVMEWNRSQTAEDFKAFRTSVYFEADGVTNGVVNAMALFSSGSFTGKWLSNIARGGYWIGEQIKSLADLRVDFARGQEDLYALAGTATTQKINALRRAYASTGVSKQFNAVRDLLAEFIEDVSINEGEGLDIKRGAVKNPLTITIYGSGANGIAGNIVDEMVSRIYEMLSVAAARKADNPDITEAQSIYGGDAASAQEKFDRLMLNLSRMAGSVIVKNKGTLYVDTIKDGVSKTFGDPTQFKFSPAVVKNMRQNVLHSFVNPMVEGITDTVGSDMMGTLHVLKTQVQAWSLVGRAAYRQAYAKALAAKNFKSKNDILSLKEEQEVLKSVMDKLPMFSTGDQSFLFGMTQRANGNTEFGRDFADKLDTPAWGYTPDNAGVAGIPGMTIGSGDGQAILNAISDPEMPKNFLQIFDGIHSSVAEMELMGRVANKAVFGSWQNNPMAALSSAFSTFVSNLDLASLDLSKQDRKDLTKSLYADWFSTPQRSDADLMNGLQHFAKTGTAMGKNIAERQAVMARVQSSVDQMAGAASPFQNLGVILSGSADQKAALLEMMRVEENTQREDQVPATPEAETSPVQAKAEPKVKPKATQLSFLNAPVVMFTKMLEKQIAKITGDRQTRALLLDVIRSGSAKDYEIYIGSREELINRAADMGIILPASRSGFMGFTDPSSQSIFVVDGNPETMLHELIHAGTYAKLQAYYDGTDTSPELAEAVKRLEGLMDQFKSLGVSAPSQTALSKGNAAWTEANSERAQMAEYLGEASSKEEFLERAAKFASDQKKALAERLKQYGLSDKVSLEVIDAADEMKLRLSGAIGYMTWDDKLVREPGKPLIVIDTTETIDKGSLPRHVLDHEVMHVFRQLGLIKENEWAVMVAAAKKIPELNRVVRLSYAGSDPRLIEEELVVEMFAMWRTGILPAFVPAKNVFARIAAFLADLINAKMGREPKLTAEAVFQMAVDGKLAERELAPIDTSYLDTRRAESRVSISQLDAYQAALDEMERQASAGNQAGELNEFMAWALANADLAQQLKETKANKAVRLARSVVQAIKALIFGGNRSFAVKDDMFTNLRFNTNIVLRSSSPAQAMAGGVLFHDPNFGNDSRIGDLLKKIQTKITDYIGTEEFTGKRRDTDVKRSLVPGSTVAMAFQAAGWSMTPQQHMTFLHMVGIMSTNAQLDPNSTVRLQELFAHVGKHLSVDDFLVNKEEDNPKDNEQASKKLNVLMGRFKDKKDGYGRSLVLPAFVALAATNPEFREVLKNIPMPKTEYVGWNSVDNILDNIGDASMDNLSRWVSGEGVRTPDIQAAIDGLTEQMLQTNADSQLFIEKFTNPVGNGIDRVNQFVVDGVKWLGDQAQAGTNRFREANPDSKVMIRALEALSTSLKLLNQEDGRAAATGLMGRLNGTKLSEPVFNFLKDMIGRTAENGEIYDMIKIARTWVNGIRQQFRKQLPKIINGKFSRELTDAVQTNLYQGIGQTGLASLLSSMTVEQVLDVLANQASRDVAIKNLMDTITELSPENAGFIQRKSKELAGWMINKKTNTNNLLRNATAIAHLLNEPTDTVAVTSPEMIEAIDHLVSLLALNELSADAQTSLADLAANEADGLNFMLSYLRGQDELDKPKLTGNAKFNHWKGYMPTERAAGVSLSILSNNGAELLLQRGYTKVSDFAGSSIDPSAKNRGYYFLPVSGNAPFAQGIMQNVHQTASGVDKATGFSLDLTAGEITEPAFVQKIAQLSGVMTETGFALLPVFDQNGKIFAYERSVDPSLVQSLTKPDTNMAKMMGIRSGRQSEEASANQLNRTLIDALRTMYDKDRKDGRQKEYINLTQSNDKIHKDAMRIFSKETKDYINARFPEGFWVRRDMVDDAIGYRQASIGDVFTGNSRWSEGTQKLVRNALIKMFGNDAYRYAIKAETAVQNFIMDARVILAVKSIVVPMASAASNILQLIGRGVPVANIFRGIPKKTAEIESWHKTRVRQIEAEAELLATDDPRDRRRLEAEIQTIKDSHKRLSIWPLLEAGEFSHISDAGSREDILLSEGRLGEYIEKAVSKLPQSVQTLGRYYLVSEDTALFRALQKSVAYGDFVAKAVLYDELTIRKGQTSEQALTQITEEFVNYDRLPGRDRAYLENIGLLWFYNFKMRSAKVALSMIRNNPVHSLMALAMPMPVSGTGLPLTDNLWYGLFENKLHWSSGFGMAFRAPGLLPAHNLFW